MKVNLKKVHPNAVIPTYAKHGDACMDFVATSVNETDNHVEYDTGIAIEIPEGYVGIVRPRSSVSNTNLVWKTSGIIDSGYRGTIRGRFQRMNDNPIPQVGERIIQLLIIPYPQIQFVEVKELSVTVRGEGGFGHTGKK